MPGPGLVMRRLAFTGRRAVTEITPAPIVVRSRSNAAVQRALLVRLEAGPDTIQRDEGDAPKETKPPPDCDRDTALAWSDFKGTPKKSKYAAKTYAPVKSVAKNTRFQAQLQSKRSWVKAHYPHADNRVYPPIPPQLAACKKTFGDLKDGQTGWYTIEYSVTSKCAAGIAPPAKKKAASESDCDDYETDADTAGAKESARLLAHEQTHYDISCSVARKANSLVAAAVKFRTVRKRINDKKKGLRSLQDKFDRDSKHGCITSGQDDWAKNHAAKVEATFKDLDPTPTTGEKESEDAKSE